MRQVLGTGDPTLSHCPPTGDHVLAGRWATDRKIRSKAMKGGKKDKVEKSKRGGDEPGKASLML